MLHLLYSFLVFLFASAVLITAFYAITRGETETLPDGSMERYGKVLKGYYFFWFKEKGSDRLYYNGDELAGLLLKIQERYNGNVSLIGDIFIPGSITTFKATIDFLEHIPYLRSSLQVRFEALQHDANTVLLKVYQEDPVYVFPAWLRTVMAGCITCMPTVYGNLIYWGTFLLIRRDVLNRAFYQYFNYPVAGIIAIWLAYWLSLAWLTTVLWNIYYREQ